MNIYIFFFFLLTTNAFGKKKRIKKVIKNIHINLDYEIMAYENCGSYNVVYNNNA